MMTFVVERIRRRPGAVPPSRATPAPVKRPMSRTEIADEVAKLKEQARHLRPPLNMQPNAFHEDKSDLVRAIERLEDAVRGNRQIAPESAETR